MTGRGSARRESGESVAAGYVAALGAMDEEALLAAFAPDAVVYLPAGSAPARGRPEIREAIRCVFAAAEPVELQEDLVVGAGDTAAVKWTGRWRALDGEVSFGGIDVFEVNPEGRIVTWRAYWDRSAFVPGDEREGSI